MFYKSLTLSQILTQKFTLVQGDGHVNINMNIKTFVSINIITNIDINMNINQNTPKPIKILFNCVTYCQ